MIRTKLLALLIVALFAVAASAQSRGYQARSTSANTASTSAENNGEGFQSEGQGQGQQQGHHPPPQAFAACENKAAGAECSFTGRNNETRTGTCFQIPAEQGNSSQNPNAGSE